MCVETLEDFSLNHIIALSFPADTGGLNSQIKAFKEYLRADLAQLLLHVSVSFC